MNGLSKNKMLLLTFHGIGQIKRKLIGQDYKVWISNNVFNDICSYAAVNPNIRITFDDGNLSDYDIAMPVLSSFNLKSEFFVTADNIGRKGYLNKTHLRELKKIGMQIGTHGMFHRSWRRLPYHELNIELIDSKKIIEDIIGEEIISAACPFGEYDRTVLKTLKILNYKQVYTSDGGLANITDWLKHRNSIYTSHSLSHINDLLYEYSNNKIKNFYKQIKSKIKSLR